MVGHKCNSARLGITKAVSEYQLPGAHMTHEVAYIPSTCKGAGDVLLLSQHGPSRLLRMELDATTGQPSCVHSFMLGESGMYSGVHGLAGSTKFPGSAWAVLQFENAILLLNASERCEQDIVEQRFELPDSVSGPHSIIEQDDFLWITCKESGHVVKMNASTGDAEGVYPCDGEPIFVGIHPTSGDVYASLDLQSQIFRISPSGKTSRMDVGDNHGKIPVGLVAGPDGNLWFVLLKPKSDSGAFCRISGDGSQTWFTLLSPPPSRMAGFLHLAFDSSFDGQKLRMWLLSSSIISTRSIDAVFAVTLDIPSGNMMSQETLCLATYANAAHRVLPHKSGLFVTQLTKSVLAHVTGTSTQLHVASLKCGCSSGKACSCKCNGDCGCPPACACKAGRAEYRFHEH